MAHDCAGCHGDCACKTSDTYQAAEWYGGHVHPMPTEQAVGTVEPHELDPGQPCPSCKRRVPYPKTAASPKTKVVAFRAPVDEVEAFKENLEVAAQHVGAAGRPHDAFWTMTAAIAALLQAEDWKGALARGGS